VSAAPLTVVDVKDAARTAARDMLRFLAMSMTIPADVIAGAERRISGLYPTPSTSVLRVEPDPEGAEVLSAKLFTAQLYWTWSPAEQTVLPCYDDGALIAFRQICAHLKPTAKRIELWLDLKRTPTREVETR
jgi:hypothetical protein